ncbi:MAG TPA: S9 family peptidase, partial [Bryobacteraceae bacterium]|nr:S9 family peptidase [Bryobacteraceae bacterium]
MPRILVLFVAACVFAPAQVKKPFDFDALMRVARISEPALSPDGQRVAFTVEQPDLQKNTRPKQIWMVTAAGTGVAVQVTKDGTSNQRPRWAPDSKRLLFVSNRSGTNQIWSMNSDGSEPKQLTNLALGAEGVTVARDGRTIVFTSGVYTGCTEEACNKQKADADKDKVKPRVHTTLLYRHWNQWQGPTRQHLFVLPIEGGTPKDLTPGDFDVPAFSLGGQDDYAISPDAQEVAYVANTDKDQATSTNTDVFVVPITGGEPKRLSAGGGADRSPTYSPDGKFVAFRSQLRAGYESDRWRLILVDRATGSATVRTEGLDRNVEEITWSHDGSRIFYTAEDRGRVSLHLVAATGGASRPIIFGDSHVGDVQLSDDGKTMVYSETRGSRPVEIYRASSSGGAAIPLARLNDALLSQYQLTALEEFWVENPNDKARVHSFFIKPPGFQAGRKYPILLLIHGGPQGAWGEAWSYRWNAQVFAGAGYVVVMPNPRGSTGYGQKFTDDINQDWGGKVYEDIMSVVDYAAAQPYVDADRIAAAGGSYGGYMVNWLLGHTDRFKAFVSHAGVFDLRSMAGETEELWFPLWEFRGMPWDNPEVYEKFSPSYYVRDFKTPTLVLHGELDYRVPVGQGMQLFTALQTRKVPSKMVLYPDEG